MVPAKIVKKFDLFLQCLWLLPNLWTSGVKVKTGALEFAMKAIFT